MGAVRRRSPRDRGAVTVEAAIALGAFVIVLAIALGAIAAVTDQLRCTDAAREAARLAARGDTERARVAAERIAPGGARVTISVRGDTVEVDVHADPASGLLPGIRVHGEAFAVTEPGVGAAR